MLNLTNLLNKLDIFTLLDWQRLKILMITYPLFNTGLTALLISVSGTVNSDNFILEGNLTRSTNNEIKLKSFNSAIPFLEIYFMEMLAKLCRIYMEEVY